MKNFNIKLILLLTCLFIIQDTVYAADLKSFVIDADAFYSEYPPNLSCKECSYTIRQLVERYNIKEKNILSVGPGTAFEEYWFMKYGKNRMTFIDIDEGHSILPMLTKMINDKKLENGNGNNKEKINYLIGDATIDSIPASLKKDGFDVLYFSGFTPHELNLSRIYKNKLKNNIWPKDEKVIHESIINLTNKLLLPSGLLIIQEYAGSPDINASGYLESIKNELLTNGITLLEVYSFGNSNHIHLIVGIKGFSNDENVKLFLQHLKNAKLITRFHGRAEQQDDYLSKQAYFWQ